MLVFTEYVHLDQLAKNVNLEKIMIIKKIYTLMYQPALCAPLKL